MRQIKSRDTSPELAVRRLIYRLGYRYRLHKKNLPGKPDIVFSGRRKVIFVHGCFWHMHDCKRGKRIPKTNKDYWVSKLTRNKKRDVQHIKALEDDGWKVLVIWECEIKDLSNVEDQVRAFLDNV